MSGENEMDGDNINVVIRVRPLSAKEQKVILFAVREILFYRHTDSKMTF